MLDTGKLIIISVSCMVKWYHLFITSSMCRDSKLLHVLGCLGNVILKYVNHLDYTVLQELSPLGGQDITHGSLCQQLFSHSLVSDELCNVSEDIDHGAVATIPADKTENS